MAAPKGNQYAKGCETSGRPGGVDLSEEARLLIEWADTDDAIVLREWAAIRRYAAQEKLTAYCQQSEEFRTAYNIARLKIGARREKMLALGKGHAAPFMRYASLYDKELKAHETELKANENAAKLQGLSSEFSEFLSVVKGQNGSSPAIPKAD